MSQRTIKPRLALSDDEEIDIVPLDIPTESKPLPKKKLEEIELKYPFDIKNLPQKIVNTFDDFGFTKQKVYDVSCFSSMQYITRQIGSKLHQEHPEYQYRVYSYRAISKVKDTTVISKLRIVYSFDHFKKYIHVNIELLA